jgi:DNA-binding NarL/FixJ family response regulator
VSAAIRVAVVDDDADIRESLALLIGDSPGFRGAGTYADVESALEGLAQDTPDVVLMDVGLPGLSGIEGTAEIRRRWPDVDVVMLTVHADEDLVFRALAAGATGYLLKESSTERILDAVRDVRRGGAPMSRSIARRVVASFRRAEASPLSARETEVLAHLCEGRSYRHAAKALFVSEETVHFHIKNIYRKLEVHSKSEAVARALRDRLV